MIRSITNKNIILDLDETCLHSFQNIDLLHQSGILTDPRAIKLRKRIYILNINDLYGRGDGKVTQIWGIMRPGLRKFLKFCFNYFNIVTVWSAGIPKYVHAAVNSIFKGLPKPNVIFSRPDCLNEAPKGSRDLILSKPIEKMINYNSKLKELMNLSNTFIVDDRIDYVKFNFNNGIIIPPYNPSPTIESFKLKDYALIKIIIWLLRQDTMNAQDVRFIKKDNIFTIPMGDVGNYISTSNTDMYLKQDDLLVNKLQNMSLYITNNYPNMIAESGLTVKA